MTKIKFSHVLTVALLALGTLSIAACGTLNGIGQDVESAGEAVQDAAN